ncbi:uncharacterized protein LOC135145045 isoform X2 [Zophobas morio]|uniref:uncharacterized protein LOC135120540 isoform X2 n=1 Tax=Zophobas morio TaxID=2755281 RepID=UPI0030838890
MSEEESLLFVKFYQRQAHYFPDCERYQSLNKSSIYKVLSDGILLSKIISATFEDPLLVKLIKIPADTDAEKEHNLLRVGEDPHGFLWEVLRCNLLKNVSLSENLALIRSLERGEDLYVLINLSPEGILLRWVNYHLKRAQKDVILSSIESGLNDVDVLITVIEQCVQDSDPAKMSKVKDLSNTDEKIHCFLSVLRELGLENYLTQRAIEDNCYRVILAFLAEIFHQHLGMYLPSEEEMDSINEELLALVKKLEACESVCENLSTRKTIIETELELLRQKCSDAEILANQTLAELTEKNAEFTRKSEDFSVEFDALKKLISKKVKEIEECNKNMESLSQQHEDYVSNSTKIIGDQLTRIEELECRKKGLEEKKQSIWEAIGGASQESTQLGETLSSVTQQSHDLSRTITNHAEKAEQKLSEWSQLLDFSVTTLSKANDKLTLDTCLSGHKELLERYRLKFCEAEDTFQQQKLEFGKRLKTLTVTANEGIDVEVESAEPDAALETMKGLINLLMEKIRKQTEQVALYDHSIKKMDELNAIVSEKIRDLAESNKKKTPKSKK